MSKYTSTQLVTPICIIERSRSLPDDSEATHRAADLDDFPSFRSGMNGASMDKQETDDSDEMDRFEDASPDTPVHGFKRGKEERAPSPDDDDGGGDRSNAVVPERPLGSAEIASPPDGVVPNLEATIGGTAQDDIAPPPAVQPPSDAWVPMTSRETGPPESEYDEPEEGESSSAEDPTSRLKSATAETGTREVADETRGKSTVEFPDERDTLIEELGELPPRIPSTTVDIPPASTTTTTTTTTRREPSTPGAVLPDDDQRRAPAALPEVHLVKAKIISAEEALAGLGRATAVKIDAPSATESYAPPFVDAEAAIEASTFLPQFATLTKSASEAVLASVEEEEEEEGVEEEGGSKVSGKNFKSEILLDLSRVESSAENARRREKRALCRVESDGSVGGVGRGKSARARTFFPTGEERATIVAPEEPAGATRAAKEEVAGGTRGGGTDGISRRAVVAVVQDVSDGGCSSGAERKSHEEESPIEGEPEPREESNVERDLVSDDFAGKLLPESSTNTDLAVPRLDEGADRPGGSPESDVLLVPPPSTPVPPPPSQPAPPLSPQPPPPPRPPEPPERRFARDKYNVAPDHDDERRPIVERRANREKSLPRLENVDRRVADKREEGAIRRQHSLRYQSQTLETCPTGRALSLSLEDVLKLQGGLVAEKREVETQTQQESKNTQCGSDEAFDAPREAEEPSASKFVVDSRRREVETQTQGETKGTQCDPRELEDESQGTSSSAPRTPSKEVEAQTERKVKCVRYTDQESIDSSPTKPSASFRKPSSARSRVFFAENRREVEVQTCQESKATQCDGDEDSGGSLASPFAAGSPGTSGQSRQSARPVREPLSARDDSVVTVRGPPGKIPVIVFVEGSSSDMTVTHGYRDKEGNVAWTKHWGPERLVEIYREPKSSLGLSIVGGKVDLYNGGPSKDQNISGIFIKNVLPNSPAGRTGGLKIGDRIIEVDGVDLRSGTHERAVEVIRTSGNPVCLLVQSLVHTSPDYDDQTERRDEADGGGRVFRRQDTKGYGDHASGLSAASFRRKPSAVSPAKSITPDLIQEGIGDVERQAASRSDVRRQSTKREADDASLAMRRSSVKKSLRKKAPSPPANSEALGPVSEERDEQPRRKEAVSKAKYSSDESSDEEDTRDLEGNVYTKGGIEISRRSAGNVKRSKEEIEADPEEEDEFGYTNQKVKKRYHGLGHTVTMVKLEKDRRGLGISIAGHKDRNKMAVFVCGLNPKGVAYKSGGLQIGDEILEVNGTVLQGRCHLNASALIKGMPGTCFKVIVVRRSSGLNDLAVKPIVQFPPSLEEDADRFSQYKGVRTVAIKKGQYGLGIMIIEGKHAEVGQGIFVSDIQEGSAAEQAGLQVGDMILAVNLDSLLGSSYDEATGLLKKTEGVVTLTVCNPNQSKVAKEEEERAKGGGAGDKSAGEQAKECPPKEPEKPKEPEPPKDPKDCEIAVGRETVIEFPKEKDKGIGFNIAGGSDTPLGGVIVLDVFADGAAGKDGRLKPGDRIIEMCRESFKAIEHAKAREVILKAAGPINMKVLREETPPEEFEVELQKKAGKGAGLCLTGFKSGKGAYVSEMLPGCAAAECNKLAKGDQVIAVCGQDLREAAVEDIALHVKISNPVQLRLARHKLAKQ